MRRKQILIFSLFLSVIFILSGCQKQTDNITIDPSSENPRYEWGTVSGETITIWGDRDDLARSYMVKAFERYEKLTGNFIETRALTKQELDELVPQTFASDATEKPDILFSLGGTNIERLNPNENFYDFTDAPWIDDLSDVALTQAIFEGKVMGLPHSEAAISGTLYNKSVFNKYNIKVPTTQEEFMQVCETLLKNGITPLYLPYKEITMLLYQFPMNTVITDRKIIDELNNGNLSYSDIPEMKSIVEWYKTMADKGYLGDDYTNYDWNGMDDAMKNKKYGMMVAWDTWIYTNYTGDTTNIGFMPYFMSTPENGAYGGPVITTCFVNKKSPNLDASLDLITFMADPYNYNVAFEGIYTTPVFKNQSGSITTPQYMENEMQINKLFYHSVVPSQVSGFSQIDATYIQDYMQGKCTVDECLQGMNDARLKRAKIKLTQ